VQLVDDRVAVPQGVHREHRCSPLRGATPRGRGRRSKRSHRSDIMYPPRRPVPPS
jgi:hypothetical protein